MIDGLTEEQAESLEHDWTFWRREEQTPPEGDWTTWLYMGGRGAGKTKTGAEWVRDQVKLNYKLIGAIGPTADDVRSVMVEGISGLMATAWAGDRDTAGRPIGLPEYQSSRRRIVWPNGAICRLFSAEEPERLRGPQHQRLWCDELGAWKYATETWDMAQFGLRISGPNGESPRQIVTTTPRPIPVVKMLTRDPTVVVTRGSSERNRANLADKFYTDITRKYQGTRLGRQELGGELLEDIPGAIFTRAMFEANRIKPDQVPTLQRIVVAIDPSGAGDDDVEEHNEIGIVLAGMGVDGKGYMFNDETCLGSPKVWARVAVSLYRTKKADRIVAEVNYGGAMVEAVIRAVDPRVAYKQVTASRGKVVRAEPVSALCDQNRIKFVGSFPYLEDELCSFTENGYVGDSSPNRADAFVWAITDMMLGDDSYTLTKEMLA